VQPKLETLADTYQSEPVYAQVLRWIQLRFHEHWIELELTISYVEPPRFSALYEAIRYQQWMCPAIPANYLATPKKKRVATEKAEKASTKGTDSSATTQKSDGSYVANTNKIQKLVEKGGGGWEDRDLPQIRRNGRQIGTGAENHCWIGNVPRVAYQGRLLHQLSTTQVKHFCTWHSHRPRR
jgi:hypothetical protein